MWIGSIPFGVQYDEVGIDLPRGARIIHVEMAGQNILLHHLSPDGANYSAQWLFISTGGRTVPLDYEFVGFVRRDDSTGIYVFHRRDDG